MVPLRDVVGEAGAFHRPVKLRQHRGYPGCKPAFVCEVDRLSVTGLNAHRGKASKTHQCVEFSREGRGLNSLLGRARLRIPFRLVSRPAQEAR